MTQKQIKQELKRKVEERDWIIIALVILWFLTLAFFNMGLW
ncbi:MAG: hypothetical protein ABSG05_03600 [Candidatus Pacearchaeota archaeon]|jgi:hypothetical protein